MFVTLTHHYSPYIITLVSTNDENSGNCRWIDFSFKIHTHSLVTPVSRTRSVFSLSVYSRLTIAATVGKDREWLEFPFTRLQTRDPNSCDWIGALGGTKLSCYQVPFIIIYVKPCATIPSSDQNLHFLLRAA